MKRTLMIATILTPFLLGACAGGGPANQIALASSDALNDVVGPPVTTNGTVYSDALSCLKGSGHASSVYAVGPIPDNTGKYVIEQDGAILPRSASEMAVTAMHLAGAKQVDRLTSGIVEWELKFASKKVLGDGGKSRIRVGTDKATGKPIYKEVNFRVVKHGDMLGSTHYVTGSISELNWNTFSGGAELEILGIGGGARMFMMTIAVDMKLVDSRSTLVVDNVTYKKRVLGYETKGGAFRFFGTTLVNFNIGEKSQEPIQLALRSIVERSTYELLSRRAAPEAKTACDNLLKDGDKQVTTVEAVPAASIETPTTNNTYGDETTIDATFDDIGTAPAKTAAKGASDADRAKAWKAAKTGEKS